MKKPPISLTARPTTLAGIIEHVHLCLGKDTIVLQDLLYFMAYDLMLFPPSKCQKTIGIAEKRGFISISPDKMVTFPPGSK